MVSKQFHFESYQTENHYRSTLTKDQSNDNFRKALSGKERSIKRDTL